VNSIGERSRKLLGLARLARCSALLTAVLVVARPASAQDTIATLRIPGPIQFILGDDSLSRARDLPVEAYARNGRRLFGFSGRAKMRDSRIASLNGLTLTPHARGITIASLWSQGINTAIGVHVYQRVASLASLDTLLRIPPDGQLLAIPLALAPGEQQRQRLPAGQWMLTMLPESDTTPDGVRLRVEGAQCTPNLLNTPRRFGCRVAKTAEIVVYRPVLRVRASTRASAPVALRHAYLLVRILHGG
jgi:hypothetical protein